MWEWVLALGWPEAQNHCCGQPGVVMSPETQFTSIDLEFGAMGDCLVLSFTRIGPFLESKVMSIAHFSIPYVDSVSFHTVVGKGVKCIM